MKLSDEIIQWNYPRNIPFFEIYQNQKLKMSATFRKSPPDVLLGKGIPKICSKFTGEHPRHSVISIKLLCKFIEITLRHGCYPVHLLHIFKRPFPKNTSGGLLLSYTFKDVLVTCFSLWHFREIVDYKNFLLKKIILLLTMYVLPRLVFKQICTKMRKTSRKPPAHDATMIMSFVLDSPSAAIGIGLTSKQTHDRFLQIFSWCK